MIVYNCLVYTIRDFDVIVLELVLKKEKKNDVDY